MNLHLSRLRLVLSAAAVLAFAGVAHADPTYTYTVTTTGSNGDSITGTITGYDMTITAFDITATDGSVTYIFNSTDTLADSSQFYAQGLEMQDGTPENLIDLQYTDYSDSTTDGDLSIHVTGDLSTGLVYVGGQEAYYMGGDLGITYPAAEVKDYEMNPVVSTDIAFSGGPNSVVTPEPSSLALLATGLFVGCATLRKHFTRA